MSDYSAPYKQGNFSSSPTSGSTFFSVAGFTPDAGDVGRLIVITTGNGRLQHREILSVSGQDITISHPWDSNPFVDPTDDNRMTDVLPTSGDTVVITYDVSDLIATDPDMALTNQNNLKITGILSVSGNAYLHFKNYNVEFDSRNINISQGGGLIFGYYNYVPNEDGYVKDICNVTDIAVGSGGGQLVGAGFGMYDQYGGTLYVPNSNFWRGFSGAVAPREFQVRLFDVFSIGSFGSRIDGERTILKYSGVNSVSTTGICNPLSSVARIELSVTNSDQCLYIFTVTGPRGTAIFTRIADINIRIVRLIGANPPSPEVYNIIAKKAEIDAIELTGVPLVNSSITYTNQTIRYGNFLRPKYIDSGGSTITDTVKTRLYDQTGAFITENTITNGFYPNEFIRHTDIVPVAGDNFLNSGVLYAPYSLRAVTYGKVFTLTVVNAEDTFNSNIVKLDDLTITESDGLIVAAYPYSIAFDGTTLTITGDGATLQTATANQLYDFAVLWLRDNLTDEEQFLFRRVDDTIFGTTTSISTGINITLEYINFQGSITLDNDKEVVLNNGSTVSGGVIDVNGDSFLSTSSLPDSWSVFGDAPDSQNCFPNPPLGTGNVGEIFRFTFSAGTTYYVLTQGIVVAIEPITTGETVVDLSQTGLQIIANQTLDTISQELGFIPAIIYVNTSLIENGDGTAKTPYNNLDQAVNKFNQGGFTYISLKSSLSQPAIPTISLQGVKIEGIDKFSVLNFNGQSLEGSTLLNLLVLGTQNVSDVFGVIIENSRIIGDYVNFKGIIKESEFVNPTGGQINVSVNVNATVLDSSCINAVDVNFDLQNSVIFGVRNSDGNIRVSNLTANSASFELNSGNLDIDASCTGGFIRINDTVNVIGGTGGTALNTDGVTLNAMPNKLWVDDNTYTGNQKGKIVEDARNFALAAKNNALI